MIIMSQFTDRTWHVKLS